jgi:phosphoribosylformylglycinamidine cyclo-ligase
MSKKMTYASAGVDYDPMDRFKQMAQNAAHTTAQNIERLGFRVVLESYGESVFLIEPIDGNSYITAHVEEGLGTKNLVADAMYRLTGRSYYDHIAQDTVAMIVNDMITLGALPLSVAMHLAAGDSNWFKDEKRCRDLILGWKNACDLARCVWGPGETPTLKDIVLPEAVILSGSAVGIVEGYPIMPKDICHGDAIILIESSGIHANGLTMTREIAANISPYPDQPELGYLTKLDDGRTYGETLLDPTIIYVPFVEECLNSGVDIKYAVNITGHGWRKLMRAPQSFTYVIEHLPKQLPIFDFIQKYVDDEEAYGNLNMGAGFALYVSENDVDLVFEVSASHKLGVLWGGHIERSEEKKVIIKPKGLEYTKLDVR